MTFIPASHVLGQVETWTELIPQSAQVNLGDLIPCPRGHRGLQAAWVGVRRGRHDPVSLKEVWDERMGTGIGRLRERSRVHWEIAGFPWCPESGSFRAPGNQAVPLTSSGGASGAASS